MADGRGSPGRRALVGALLAALLTPACGGGGGGGGSPAPPGPRLVSATFYGGSGGDTTPDPGETIRLSFDVKMEVRSGTTFDAGHLALSGGGSIGSGALTLTRVNAYTYDVTLGSGVTFTPGTTTLDVATGQNVLISTGGTNAEPGGAQTIQTGTPDITVMTIASIPAALGADGAGGGTLLVPTQGFPLDLSWYDRDGGTAPFANLVVGASVAVTTSAGTVAAGGDLTGFFTATNPSSSGVRLTAQGGLVFPEGSFTLWAAITDQEGKPSPRTAIDLVGADPDADLTPFESTAHAQQVWYLDLTRDRQAILVSGSSTLTVTVTAGADGTPDFLEDLETLGLRATAPLFSDLGNGTHPNDFLLARVKEAIRTNLETLFSGAPIAFTFDDPGGFPAVLQTAWSAASHSRIAVGGSSELSSLGLAFYDERNQNQVDNTVWSGSSPSYVVSLGVFSTELITFSVNASPTVTFRQTFDSLMPGRGTPAGQGADDYNVLRYLAGLTGSTTNTTRADAIQDAWTRLGRFLAVVLAHETGHSMGLVEDGAPPTGLHGAASGFPGSDSGHVDLSTTGLYPYPAQNVMAPAISFLGSLSGSTGINELNLAWLRGQVLYLGTTSGKVPGW